MEDFLIYIAKSAAAAGAFYLLYLMLFQHQKQFVFNRVYLPVSLALSFIIPLITFTSVKYIQLPPVTVHTDSFAYLAESETAQQAPGFNLEWFHYVIGIYVLGILSFSLYLVLGHFKAFSIIKKSRLHKLFNIDVNVTLKDVHPFSFFNKIVLSDKTLDNPNLAMIVQHEEIHVREKHTLDILFAEILFLFQWFNPFAWLLKDAIKNNLEYKTDHQVTKTIDPLQYQLAMVGLAHKEGIAPFLTALNGSQLKNRIVMMKRKTGNKYALLKQLLVLPLLAVLTMSLSNKEVKTQIVESTKQLEIVVDGETISQNDPRFQSVDFSDGIDGREVMLALGIENKVILNGYSDESDPNIYFIQTSDYVLGSNAEFDKLISPANKEKNKVSGKITDDAGNPISGASVIVKGKTTGTITDTEGNYLLKLPGEDETLIFSATGYQNKEVAVDGKEEINIQLVPKSESKDKLKEVVVTGYGTLQKRTEPATKEELKEVEVTGYAAPANNKTPTYKNKVSGKVTNSEGEPLKGAAILIKGKATGTITDENGNYLLGDENPIETLVFSMAGYHLMQQEVAGKTTIDATLEKDNEDPVKLRLRSGKHNGVNVEMKNIKITSSQKEEAPLYIVDGITLESIENISFENIESISVLKEASSTALYGDKGKNGVVLVTTKNKGLENRKPLVVVDGEIRTDEDWQKIDPNTISHISVLKDSPSITKYGAAGEDGVIQITTKDFKITSELQLRKFIAQEILYPKAAIKNNKEGVAQLFVKINSDGVVTSIDEKSEGHEKFLDEVVVVGKQPKTEEVVVASAIEDISNVFKDETKRVIYSMPVINVPEFKGNTIGITVKFVLQ